ncbi:MAG: hypothetical protein ACLGIY_24785, partial [Betaproteobacteria bacterium]
CQKQTNLAALATPFGNDDAPLGRRARAGHCDFQWGAADIFIMGRLTPPERYAALFIEVL